MKRINSITIISLIMWIGIFSCEKDTDFNLNEFREDKYYESEIFDELNLNIYGKWKLYGVSGGIHGGGHELNFDYFEVHKFGIYGFIRNGRIIEFGKIEIDEQTNEELLITLKPDNDSEVFMYDSEKYVNLFGSDTLSLDSPCCDRYNYHFKKINCDCQE